MKMTGKVDAKTRRALRLKLGSRTNRRMGVKSHGAAPPKLRLAEAIKKYLADHAQNA